MTGLRHASKRLLRAPTFTLVTILSVGFGAGAFASILSVVEGALLEAPPYREPDRLVWVWRNYTWFTFPRGWLGGPDIAYLRERTEAFESIVAFDADDTNVTDMDGGSPEEVDVLLASAEFFDVLGVRPLLGRGFAAGESDAQAQGVVVLGYDLWQRRYGGDPGMIGRDILLYGSPQRVIGVMPRGFRFVMHASLGDPVAADLYANLQTDLAAESPGRGAFAAMARVRAGAESRVQPALDAVAERLDTESFGSRGLRLWSIGLREDLSAPVRPELAALFGAGTFLLLALAASLATLMVARAADRARDVALRSALGAGRLGSVLDLLGESVIVCVAGCLLGLAIAPLALDALLSMAPPSLPGIEAIGVDGSVIAITLVTCLLLGLGAAIGPALGVARRPVWTGLRATGPRAGGSSDASRVRSVLVTVQVALSLMLLVGAGLLGRSMSALLRVDPGFDANGVLTVRVPLSGADYPDAASAAAFHATLRDRLAAQPGVHHAGAIDALPLAGGTNQTSIAFPNAPGNSGDATTDRPLIDYFRTSPEWFASLGIAVIDGRPIDTRDQSASAGVAVIDETLARRFFPSSSPVGHRMAVDADTVTIIGVARHARFYNVFSDDRGMVWLPATQRVAGTMYYALRTDREPLSLLEPVRAVLRQLDASIPLTDVQSMTAVVRASLGQHQLSLVLIGGFAFGALVLAVMGIYGVVANSVVRRTHEFGVRLALGAERRGIVALALGGGLRVIAAGLAIGLIGALLASRVLDSLLFGLRAGDPLTFAAVATLLGAVGVLACLIPGWRAARIPPAEALRTD